MRIVYGREKLCDELDVTPKQLRALARHGCPIVVIGCGNGTRYMANMPAIESWFAVPRTTRRQKGAAYVQR